MREGSPEVGARRSEQGAGRLGRRIPGAGAAAGECAGTPLCPPAPGRCSWVRTSGMGRTPAPGRATLGKAGNPDASLRGVRVLGGGSELGVLRFLRGRWIWEPGRCWQGCQLPSFSQSLYLSGLKPVLFMLRNLLGVHIKEVWGLLPPQSSLSRTLKTQKLDF